MEHREEISHGTENGVKSESLDLQKADDDSQWDKSVKTQSSRSWGCKKNGLKRKLDSEAASEVRKKSRKEVLLTSLLSGRKNKKKGTRGGGDGGLSGILPKLNGAVNIPKRPRDLVRRKKFDVDLASLQKGVSEDREMLADGMGKWYGNRNGSSHHNGNSNGVLPQHESEEAFTDGVIRKVKREKTSANHKENTTNRYDLAHKRDNFPSPVHIGDSLMKKDRRHRKKVTETRLSDFGVSKEVKQFPNEPSRIIDETQDDEENLEANAAIMLSSRFDPSCTAFSSGCKISNGSFTNGLSATSSSPTTLVESNIASSAQQNGKSLSKKRRYFYEVLSKDFDSYWVLNRRIKVFWPLDNIWYFGHVIGYDPEKKLHHVKYDDRDEEWIDLQSEMFKLSLLPSEVPRKVGRKRSTTKGHHSGKRKRVETADKEQLNNSYMDSEPIISWLGRSASHKSAPFGTRKRQITRQESGESSLPLVCEGKGELREILEVKSSVNDADNLACVSDVPNSPRVSTRDTNFLDHNIISKNRFPVVYFRRRFKKQSQPSSDIHVPDLCQLFKEQPVCETASKFVDSPDRGLDMLQSMVKWDCHNEHLVSNEFIWDIDCFGRLKMIIPVTGSKVFKCELNLPLPSIGGNLFGGLNFMFMHQHVALISASRMVRLEILFVDNTVGLRFLLFDGCLMQAISFVFLVLAVFQSNQKENYVGQQLPVTSIRFQLSGLHSLAKQLVFTFCYLTEVVSSKWSYVDRKLSKHCVITKQLPPPECTSNNILALQNGLQLPLFSVSHSHSSVTNRCRPQRLSKSTRESSVVKLSHVTSDSDEKLPPFALSFSAAPKFFISLHLRLLMERSVSLASHGEQDLISLMDCSGDDLGVVSVDRLVAKDNSVISTVSLVLPENEEISQTDIRTTLASESENCVMKAGRMSSDDKFLPVDPEIGCGPKVDLAIGIPSLNSSESPANAGTQSVQHLADSAVTCYDDVTHDPSPSQILFHNSRNGDVNASTSACLSPGRSDSKKDFLQNGLGNGPKKPRTRVSYSMPRGGNDFNNKNNFHHGKGFSHKRIRKAKEKKTSEAFGGLKRNLELSSCDGNCLVIVGDRGWRECGARVVLELVNHNEWRLAVKFSGSTKYSHKAHQFLQPGSTNRFTHAMMWKGGKDWILEFTDRSQWTIFKEMYVECYNRNLRAASVKNIPIPGVRLIEENDESVPELPYLRPSSKYHQQFESDIDIAMNPSRVLYDMDSDDEQWLAKRRGLDFNECGCGDVSDEMFEKTMDAFEKFAYAKQCDHFTLDELEDVMTGFVTFNAVISIYEHWREKRLRKGMPLIRHLQPPLWEKYKQQLKEWEKVGSALAPSSGCSDKSSVVEKPAMFAFCLKPRGLGVPHRGLKQRSQKRLSNSFLSNGVPGDPESLHSPVGRRLNGFSFGDDRLAYSSDKECASDFSPVLQQSIRVSSPREAGGSMGHFSLNSDGFEKNYYSKPHKVKSKKLCLIPTSNDQFASHRPRNMGMRSTSHIWPSKMNCGHVGPSDLDEFRLRDATSAARHAATIAKMKRENAQRMLCRADLAKHKAAVAILIAESVKASYEETDDDDDDDDDDDEDDDEMTG